MSNSSQPKNSSDDLVNDQIIKDLMISASGTGVSNDYITITSGNDVYIDNTMFSGGTITLPGNLYTVNASDTITLNDTFTINWGQTEWVDSFPDWGRVQDMCAQYPSLEVALRNLETIYNLIKDDYDNPTPKK